ncbi:MAG: aryl-sulfate sulfotransferase [Deltaproteobacteria bacterium]|nr:aryl-sulfate sulfotransferase [Deltaproteobacteria bacterium]
MTLLLLACQLSPASVEARGPVVVATWSATAERSRVEVNDGETEVIVTEWQEASDEAHFVPLLGLPSGGAYSAVVVTESGTATLPSTFESPAVPNDFPTWTTEGTPGWEGYMVGSLLGDTSYVTIMDEQGRAVWFLQEEGDTRVIRARPRVDGRGLWFAASRETAADDAPELVSVDWMGEELHREEIPYFSHDFVEHADETLGLLLEDVRDVEGFDVPVHGNRVTELVPGDAMVEVFTTFDAWSPSESGALHQEEDWTHGNALDWDEDTQLYTAGFRGQNAIVEFDRSGKLHRQLGGPTATYEFADKAAAIYNQHQFQWVDGGILVFDNRVAETGSRAVRYDLDDATGLATVAWSFEPEPPLWVYALGDVDENADGVLVTFSTSGTIVDVSLDAKPRWSLSADLGTVLGYTTRVPTLPGVARGP